MIRQKEGDRPTPSLSSLADQLAARFRDVEFHESGLDMNSLQDSTLHVISASGLGGAELLSVAQPGTSLDAELVDVVISESREFAPDQWQQVAGGRLLFEEAKLRHPGLVAEEQARFARRGRPTRA